MGRKFCEQSKWKIRVKKRVDEELTDPFCEMGKSVSDNVSLAKPDDIYSQEAWLLEPRCFSFQLSDIPICNHEVTLYEIRLFAREPNAEMCGQFYYEGNKLAAAFLTFPTLQQA